MKLRPYRLLGMLSALLFALSGPALAQVKVQLSQSRVELGQAFQVTFEVSGQAISPPDLSPLQQDFDIVNRNIRQQSSTINGRRSQRLALTLSLVPRRSGKLQVPSLDFGGARSPGRSIEVLPASGQEYQPSQSMPAWQGTPDAWSMSRPQVPPFRTPPPVPDGQLMEPVPVWPEEAESWSGYEPPAPAFEAPRTGSGYQAPAGSTRYGGLGRGSTPIASAPDQPPETAFQVPERFIQQRPSGNEESSWLYWVATGAFLSWLVYWRNRRRQRRAPAPTRIRQVPEPETKVEEDPTVQALRQAFQQGDVTRAREVLLRWAREVWPERPPANLCRLAMRMPGSAREAILKLDQAQYSPTPVDWKGLDPSELLRRPDSPSAEQLPTGRATARRRL